MKKKKFLMILIPILLCVTLAGWFAVTHVWLNGWFISVSDTEVTLKGDDLPDVKKLQRFTDLQLLDARLVSVDARQYEQLQQVLPDCAILWQVPALGGYFENTSTRVTAASVSEADISAMKYFESLEIVDATACTDLDAIMALKSAYPDVTVLYHVPLDEMELDYETEELTFGGADATELMAAIPYLTKLQKIDATDCPDYETLTQIRMNYPELELTYNIPAGGDAWPYDSVKLTLNDMDGETLSNILPHFSSLESITLTGTAPDNDTMYELMCAYPEIVFSWEFEVCGVSTSSLATELILSQIPMESVEEVENSLKYFYHLQRVEMCQCGISNEEMDALGKRNPQIRFVWSMPFGTGYLRTDATSFIGRTYGYAFDYPCTDNETNQLKYCVDMVCLDLGHMRMKDLSFLAYMPNLQYLILADTQATDYSVVGQLTELVYLELFNSTFTDTELLLNLTKLEDLNISWVKLKHPQLLKEMTWLKRLWATRVGLTDSENRDLTEALPNTEVFLHGQHPTDGGWRKGQHYYKMRDLLGMEYME